MLIHPLVIPNETQAVAEPVEAGGLSQTAAAEIKLDIPQERHTNEMENGIETRMAKSVKNSTVQ